MATAHIQDKLLRILIVEDSLITIDTIRETVASIPAPTELKIVGSQEAALKAFKDSKFDIVMLDLQLKQGTGFGVLRSIANLFPKPRIIVLTNFPQASYREYAFLSGANYFLDKATDMGMLQSILESIALESRVRHDGA